MAHGGARPGSGRKKGQASKKTLEIADKLKKLKCDPIEGMAKIAAQAMKEGDMQIALTAYKELAQYVAPKRKAIEISGNPDSPVAITKVERTIIDPTKEHS